jgi:DNA-binding beta-propeller fold protein YncE
VPIVVGTPRLYLADAAHNTVEEIDPTNGLLLASIRVAAGPAALALTNDGAQLLVFAAAAKELQEVDLSTNRISITVPLSLKVVNETGSAAGTWIAGRDLP